MAFETSTGFAAASVAFDETIKMPKRLWGLENQKVTAFGVLEDGNIRKPKRLWGVMTRNEAHRKVEDGTINKSKRLWERLRIFLIDLPIPRWNHQ